MKQLFLRSLKNLKSYLSTYSLLSRDFLRFTGRRGSLTVLLIITVSLLFPIPFAVLARAIVQMAEGEQMMTFQLIGQSYQISTITLIYLALIAFLVIFFSNFWANKNIIRMNMAWQDMLIWKLFNQTSEAANPALNQNAGKIEPSRYIGRKMEAVRSGFLIGRALSTGLQHIVVAGIVVIVLLWVSLPAVLILAIISLLTLPVYAHLLLQLTKVRKDAQRLGPHSRQQATGLVYESLLSRPDYRLNTEEMSDRVRSLFASNYATTNRQFDRLVTVNLLVGVHMSASILAILLLWEYSGRSGFSGAMDGSETLFFVCLLLLIRSVLTLVGLIARLTRSYSSLALLRSYLYPERKSCRECPAEGYLIRDDDGGCRVLSTGDVWLVLAPKIQHSYQLLFLSNAITDGTRRSKNAHCFIPFIGLQQIDWLIGKDAAFDNLEYELETPDGPVTLQLIAEGPSSAELPILALSQQAWRQLIDQGQFEPFRTSHIVFVLLSTSNDFGEGYDDFPAIASDGKKVLKIGRYGGLKLAYADSISSREHDGEGDAVLDDADEDL